MPGDYRFTFGPWNIHEGADPFGPVVRDPVDFARKLQVYKDLGFGGVQFHDDDVVQNIDSYSHAQVLEKAREVKKTLDDLELTAEFVAPRLWEDPRTVDGGYTANSESDRDYAIERSLRAVEIAREIGCDRIVLWLAREGTYIRESKDPVLANERIVDAINRMLAADPNIRVLIEPKPNEPMDLAYLPTMGHAVATAYATSDPSRVGALMESAHAILAGLDPSDEMAFALQHGKLWGVHLNDQNGLKYDQDKAFGSAGLRAAFNQVRVLDRAGYGKNGEWVGLDVKVMRTQKPENAFAHLKHSKETFFLLLDKVRSLDEAAVADLMARRDYEELDQLILRHLLGTS
jgi:xylose isomerase